MFYVAVSRAGRCKTGYGHAAAVRCRGIILSHLSTYTAAIQLQRELLVCPCAARLRDAGCVVAVSSTVGEQYAGCVISRPALQYAEKIAAVRAGSVAQYGTDRSYMVS